MTALSIYNNNLAFVKDTRRIELPAGKSVIAFEGVASRIKAETAMLQGKGITVLEQNYDYNLLTPANILEESVGETVKTAVTDPETGKDIFDTAEIVTSNFPGALYITDCRTTSEPSRPWLSASTTNRPETRIWNWLT